MTFDDTDLDVFEWLSEGLSPKPPAYLRLLGVCGDERSERVLANLKVVAARLQDQPERWAALIRSRNWRPTLIGCSAVLLTRDLRFRDDLLDRFRGWSWVAPQLAVALGFIHPAEAVPEFETLIRRPESPDGYKCIFAAYAVLKILGREAAREFEASEFFQSQTESPGRSRPAYDALVALRVVRGHWDFWSNRDPR